MIDILLILAVGFCVGFIVGFLVHKYEYGERED